MMFFTDEQLSQYFDHIDYPREKHASDRLQLLTEIQAHQLARVPFESLSLHYSKHRLISLDLQDLFRKVVVDSHGGYCMELNALLGAVLRDMGFVVLSVGARVRGDERFGGWSHMLNLVTVDGRRYMVDVGFGKGGAMVPVPLEGGGRGREFTTVAPLRGRLAYERLDQHTDPGQRVWVYYSADGADGPLRPRYCFAELEFFPEDFEVMNLSTMSRPTSYFVKTVLAMRTILDPGTRKAVGTFVLHKDEVKRKIGDEVELLETLKNEAERVAALEKYFRIKLSPEEQRSIKGLPTELLESGST